MASTSSCFLLQASTRRALLRSRIFTVASSANDSSIIATTKSACSGDNSDSIPSPQRGNIYSFTKPELVKLMTQWGHKPFRAKQIHEWMFDKGVVDFHAMFNIPPELRNTLHNKYTVGQLKIESDSESKDGTIKRAYQLNGGQLIESVLMVYKDGRRTACISSQAGCAMGCTFCATGQMGFSRQLTPTEIFEQVQQFSSQLRRKGERLSNVVFMGMGEPMNNYKNVMAAVHRINTDLGIGARHITISTAGVAPRIRKLATESLQVTLAVSLHQTTNAQRSAIMPINDKYPIEELLSACRYYIERTNRRVSFEWALIEGVTDSQQTAHELGHLLKGMLCHVNVIPLNETKGYEGKPTSASTMNQFIAILAQYGVTATARIRRGIDVNAGCGQLTTELLGRKRDGDGDGDGATS